MIGLARPRSKDTDLNQHSEYFTGFILAMSTALMMATSTVLNRMLKSVHYSVIMFNHMAIGVIMAFALTFFEKRKGTFFVYDSISTYILLLIGATANCIAMNMWIYST